MAFFINCPFSWAAQDAVVVAQEAIIYSDQEMTSPIGYISFGKKVKIGEVARNKASVYPIVVSGKIAFIKVVDVSTQKESMDSDDLTARRFQKKAEEVKEKKAKIVASYFSFLSQINMQHSNGQIKSKDNLRWHGLGFKAETLISKRVDLQFITNLMQTQMHQERFRAVEAGFGTAYRPFLSKTFIPRLEAHLLSVPFSTYSLDEDFRVKSYGYSASANIVLDLIFDRWGMEIYAGAHYTKLLGFNVPSPYKKIAPSFIGTKFGAGFSYSF